MITFIVCSIDEERLNSLKENINKTIGIEFEVIGFNNKEKNFGITKVYNLCAQQAKYEYLCFVHEDIAFHSIDWGKTIIEKLKEPTCGIIGFAGATIKSKVESGFGQKKLYNKINILESTDKQQKRYNNIPTNIDFQPVITLDGLCLFVKKDIWKQNPFDEKIITGFHGYDLDFSLQIAQKHINYVCNKILIEHFSSGSFNSQWIDATLKLHQQKWKDKLPMYVTKPSDFEIKKNEEFVEYLFHKYVIKSNYPLKETLGLVKKYIKKHKGRKGSINLIYKLLIKRLLPFKL